MTIIHQNNISRSEVPNATQAAPITAANGSANTAASMEQVHKDEEIWKSAQAFEASYISQMLTFSGLGDALTLGGGHAVDAFASFYLENVAEQISESGGFGLADEIYSHLVEQSLEGQ